MIENFFRLLLVVVLAFGAGKLASMFKMPAVLGFLIAGMALGPNAIGLLTQEMLDAPVYDTLISFLECGMGLMLGSEMVWRRIRSYGKQIVVITLAQSLMTFVVVSLAFSIIFYFMEIPVFLGLIFGGIALATAPAPALSIVTEYKTDGPVTKTLIPLAVIDDVIAICVFLSVMGIVLHQTAGGSIPGYLMLLVVLLPILIGLVVGWPTALLLKKAQSAKTRAIVVFAGAMVTATVTLLLNTYLMPFPILNFMMSGMVYSAVFANLIEEKVLEETMQYCNPIVGACFTLIILNLGAPLDYHLILGAGIFTVVYILFRAIGKMGGAALGAQLSHAAPTVKKYLGMTLLPHSGVSLVLTGIAVSALTGDYSQYGDIVRGTIAAAAVINEIIAVFVAKQGFKLAGEMGKAVPET
ncbi:MAG: cation:proton antiporter [Candidatus Merdivicinus sp.]|jgi:Kef-type K+ transport system membrane component KefB